MILGISTKDYLNNVNLEHAKTCKKRHITELIKFSSKTPLWKSLEGTEI